MMVFIDMTQCIFNLHQPLEELLWLNVISSCDFHFTTYCDCQCIYKSKELIHVIWYINMS